jgi:copper chaperone CopZ
VKLKVNGMTCPACVKNVKSAAMGVSGVKDAKVYLKDGKAEVVCDDKVKAQDIADAIKKEGYDTQVVK